MGRLDRTKKETYKHDCPAVCLLEHAGGRYCTIEWAFSPQLHFGPLQSDYYACDEFFEVTGSKGLIIVNRCSGKLRPAAPPLVVIDSEGEKQVDVLSDWGLGFEGSVGNFIQAVRRVPEAAPSLDAATSREILAAAIAFQERARKPAGGLVELEQEQPGGSSTSRVLSVASGRAVGMSNKWGGGQYCSILTGVGLVGCGIYNTDVADEFGFAFALCKGTPASPLVEPEDLYKAKVSITSKAARDMGITHGMTGAEALDVMLIAEKQRSRL